jgi:hypothetical protein
MPQSPEVFRGTPPAEGVLPDVIINAQVKANMDLPQAMTAIQAAVGAAAFGLVANGEYQWQRLLVDELDAEQMVCVAEGMRLSHANRIPIKLEAPGAESPYPARAIGLDRLIDITYGARRGALISAASFVAHLPGDKEIDVPDEQSAYEYLSTMTLPVVRAISDMFNVVHETLQSTNPEVRTVFGEVRRDLRALYNPRLCPDQESYDELADRIATSVFTLWCITQDTLGRALPDIQSRFGSAIPELAVQSFQSKIFGRPQISSWDRLKAFHEGLAQS